jgi:hypothetical protein
MFSMTSGFDGSRSFSSSRFCSLLINNFHQTVIPIVQEEFLVASPVAGLSVSGRVLFIPLEYSHDLVHDFQRVVANIRFDFRIPRIEFLQRLSHFVNLFFQLVDFRCDSFLEILNWLGIWMSPDQRFFVFLQLSDLLDMSFEVLEDDDNDVLLFLSFWLIHSSRLRR